MEKLLTGCLFALRDLRSRLSLEVPVGVDSSWAIDVGMAAGEAREFIIAIDIIDSQLSYVLDIPPECGAAERILTHEGTETR